MSKAQVPVVSDEFLDDTMKVAMAMQKQPGTICFDPSTTAKLVSELIFRRLEDQIEGRKPLLSPDDIIEQYRPPHS